MLPRDPLYTPATSNDDLHTVDTTGWSPADIALYSGICSVVHHCLPQVKELLQALRNSQADVSVLERKSKGHFGDAHNEYHAPGTQELSGGNFLLCLAAVLLEPSLASGWNNELKFGAFVEAWLVSVRPTRDPQVPGLEVPSSSFQAPELEAPPPGLQGPASHQEELKSFHNANFIAFCKALQPACAEVRQAPGSVPVSNGNTGRMSAWLCWKKQQATIQLSGEFFVELGFTRMFKVENLTFWA